MPLLRRRPLMRAAMVGGAGYAVGKHHAATVEHEQEQDRQIAEQQAQASPPNQPAASTVGPSSETDRIDALTKLKSLLDSGVLTEEQYESERQRLTQGI
jgi:hypothetical protein